MRLNFIVLRELGSTSAKPTTKFQQKTTASKYQIHTVTPHTPTSSRRARPQDLLPIAHRSCAAPPPCPKKSATSSNSSRSAGARMPRVRLTSPPLFLYRAGKKKKASRESEAKGKSKTNHARPKQPPASSATASPSRSSSRSGATGTCTRSCSRTRTRRTS